MTCRQGIELLSWSLYDLAVKFFTLNIVTLHFVRWISLEKQVPDIYYGLTFGLSLLVALLFSPFVGKISDVTAKKKEILAIFTLAASVLVFFLGFTQNPVLALVFFALANLGIQLAVIAYNALITSVTVSGNLGFVSGFGKMLGFIGALGILYFMTPIRESYGYHRVFQISGGLLFLFAVPCILLVKERKIEKAKKLSQAVSPAIFFSTFKSTLESFRDLCRMPGIKDLFKASFFVLCPLNTLILFMSLYLSEVFGLSESGIVGVIGVAAVVAILSSISFGVLGDRIGYKKTLYIMFCFMITGFILVALTDVKQHAFWLGGLFGLVYGVIMAVPRALAVSLVPESRVGELFGFFVWIGFLAGFAGPIPWGIVDFFFAFLGPLRYRVAMVVSGLFILPALRYFIRVPERGGRYG